MVWVEGEVVGVLGVVVGGVLEPEPELEPDPEPEPVPPLEGVFG